MTSLVHIITELKLTNDLLDQEIFRFDIVVQGMVADLKYMKWDQTQKVDIAQGSNKTHMIRCDSCRNYETLVLKIDSKYVLQHTILRLVTFSLIRVSVN